MALNIHSFPKILKMLRENRTAKEKREALTYIRSNTKKLESANVIKEEQYKELSKLVIDAFDKGDNIIRHEAYETLNVIIRDFQDHTLNLFDGMAQTNKKNRLKLLKLLEVVEENAMPMISYDTYAVKFFRDCLCNVQLSMMEWLDPSTCTDNIQKLIESENRPLSDDQRLEEETINYVMIILRRLYKIAVVTSDPKIEKFDELVMDRIIVLAYMGHKRQRGPALKLLQQAIATNIMSRMCTKHSDLWTKYKTALQTTYCKRMLLLVASCELDWATQWNISIQLLGVDLHRGAGLINNLLSVEEKAFKSTDTIIRRQAFLSWKLLADNFALDPQELATARRIKLLCIPLNAKNSKTELIALTKLEVWWHVIIKLYKDILPFVNPVITQFLNFCFGPLGDTPLLSSKFDVVCSPGKRFLKTKVVAVDALCQLIVKKDDDSSIHSSILEERLPHCISDAIFEVCYKSVIHSVAEALLVLSQLTDAEMKNRCQLCRVLWNSLIIYVQRAKTEVKEEMFRDMLPVVTELVNHAVEKPMIKDLMLDTMLIDISNLSKNIKFDGTIFLELILKFLQTSIFCDSKKNHYDAFKILLRQCIKPKDDTYSPNTLDFLKKTLDKLNSLINEDEKNIMVVSELWCILAELLTKYLQHLREAKKGCSGEQSCRILESIITFPFMYNFEHDEKQIQKIAKLWNELYIQYELQTDLLGSVKPNETLLRTASIMQNCLFKNNKCGSLITHCLDALLNTINYNCLLIQDEIPSVFQLIIDLTLSFIDNSENMECILSLKALSAMLITIFGHNTQKSVKYLEVCKPVIHAMLGCESEELFKEVANTWETVVIIIKALDKSFHYELISSYKDIIILAINHPNSTVKSQALSILNIRDTLNKDAKNILEEIAKEVNDGTTRKSESVINKKDQSSKSKQIKIVGSFLNKLSETTQPGFKKNEKANKKTIPPELETENYVFIDTDLKFDVSRMTEHQKESLKRKRDDIPALYNDISQSSSQDSQQLQEWFDKRSKCMDELDATPDKKDDILTINVFDHDGNKENKIVASKVRCTDKGINAENNTVLTDVLTQSGSQESVESGKDKRDGDASSSTVEREMGLKIKVEADDDAVSMREKQLDISMDDVCESSESELIGKRLNFESREEFPEDGVSKQRLSPSVLDNGKRRSRNNLVKSMVSASVTESSDNDAQKNAPQTEQRSLRAKGVQSKPSASNKRKPAEEVNGKDEFDDKKRGVKRKSASDSESDGSTQRRRRKSVTSENPSDSETAKSTDDENTERTGMEIDDSQLSQRTKNEISRLRINMIFDCPLPSRRRSKMQEESNKESNVKRHPSPENKESKSKNLDAKTGYIIKKGSKTPGKDTKLNLNQNTRTRRSKRATKQEMERNGESLENNDDEIETEDSPSAENANVEATSVASNDYDTQSFDVETYTNNENLLDKNVEFKESDVNVKATSKPETQDECGDIVESSQDTNAISKSEKKFNEKQCFIKINKIECVHLNKPQSPTTEENKGRHLDVPTSCGSNQNAAPPKDDAKEVEDKETEHHQNDTERSGNSETRRIEDSPSSTKSFLIGFSSPKSNIKRFSKIKTYSNQGRAAHMIGLVTKQAKIDMEGETINIDDDPENKKTRTKDGDNDASSAPPAKKDWTCLYKEGDKVMVGPLNTRREKIFNNMRTADYSLSPSRKSFLNLKNDGERISPKSDKAASENESTDVDGQEEKTVDNSASLSPDRAELPILEWSSANPPSLTASPSVSILKRNRQSVPEPEPETITPNKRKRVSFADPPVSKEMGYEIPNIGSPQKINKLPATRGLLIRKDSPLRSKQSKLRFIQIDPGKARKEDTAQLESASEIDIQCERENELLTKIAEELEYSENVAADIEVHTTPYSMQDEVDEDNISDSGLPNKVTIDKLDHDVEISVNLQSAEKQKPGTINMTEQSGKQLELSRNNETLLINEIQNVEPEHSSTQQDLFTETETNLELIPISEKDNSNATCSVNDSLPESNALDPLLNLDITADSVMDTLPIKGESEVLEDTVDAGNISGLNSTANSDEIFCGKLIRTSTQAQAAECVAEQDTLPVTDSIFGSLPLSQESQCSSQFNVETTNPELLDSIQPIYPALTTCQEPLKSILDQLSNPLWEGHLSAYFANRKLYTIGDLAQLTEREVNRIPVKGKPKVEFVRNVLKDFEKVYLAQVAVGRLVPLDDTANSDLNRSVNANASVIMHTQSQDFQTLPVLLKLETVEMATVKSKRKSPIRILPKTLSQNANTYSRCQPDLTTSTNVVLSDNSNYTSRSTKTVATSTDPISSQSATKRTKSVASQMALEDLLDEIDVNLVLQSAVRRCPPEKLLSQYKAKMNYLSEVELAKETIRLLGMESKLSSGEIALRSACRACGINKVLLRLPDIFGTDKQFFIKVLNAYRKKMKAIDCLNALNTTEVKDAICEKFTSSELAEMLSKKLKDEDQEGIKKPITDLPSLNAMLKRMPMDVIISHTVANEELIPSRVVLDIALQNNSAEEIARAIESQSPNITKSIFEKLSSSNCQLNYIERESKSKEELLDMFKAVCSKLSSQELLDAYCESMKMKLIGDYDTE